MLDQQGRQGDVGCQLQDKRLLQGHQGDEKNVNGRIEDEEVIVRKKYTKFETLRFELTK